MRKPDSSIRDRSVGLPAEHWEALAALARTTDRPVSWHIRQAVAEYLTGNPLALGRDEPFIPEPARPPAEPAIPSDPANLVEMGQPDLPAAKPVKNR